MPGAIAALEAGGAWPQGVVSNKDGEFVREEVRHLGWAPLLPVVIGAGDAAADKPDPDPILLALERMACRAGPGCLVSGRHRARHADGARGGMHRGAGGRCDVMTAGVAAAAPDLHWP